MGWRGERGVEGGGEGWNGSWACLLERKDPMGSGDLGGGGGGYGVRAEGFNEIQYVLFKQA